MKQYNKSIDVILDNIYPEHNGFSEQEIKAAEERVGVKLPEQLRSYYLKYGKHAINYTNNMLFLPEEIHTLYQSLEEMNEDPEDFMDTFGEDIDGIKENTCDYLKFYCENQGVWNAGLCFDMLDKPECHVFWDMNGIDVWQFMSKSVGSFFLSMLWENIIHSGLEFEHFENDTPLITKVLKERGVEVEELLASKLDNKYCRTCFDNNERKLYMALVNNGGELVELAIIDYSQFE